VLNVDENVRVEPILTGIATTDTFIVFCALVRLIKNAAAAPRMGILCAALESLRRYPPAVAARLILCAAEAYFLSFDMSVLVTEIEAATGWKTRFRALAAGENESEPLAAESLRRKAPAAPVIESEPAAATNLRAIALAAPPIARDPAAPTNFLTLAIPLALIEINAFAPLSDSSFASAITERLALALAAVSLRRNEALAVLIEADPIALEGLRTKEAPAVLIPVD
jgi:hypothetical protein